MGERLSIDQLAERRADILLKRHGVVTKRAINSDSLGWGWRPIYSALNLMELRGKVRRGYFVKGLPGVQFADVGFVDTMRSIGNGGEPVSDCVIVATDPAYVFDPRLASISNAPEANLLSINRIATTRIVFINGVPKLIAYSGGAKIETDGMSANEDVEMAMTILVESLMRTSSGRRIVISEWNGEPVMNSSAASMLGKLGFRREYPNMIMDAVSAMALR